MAVDPEMRDDLYKELVDEFAGYGLIDARTAYDLADRAEEHADRRTARALRIVAQVFKDGDWMNQQYGTHPKTFLEDAANRFDPDVEAEN